jgi:hypothetical protein
MGTPVAQKYWIICTKIRDSMYFIPAQFIVELKLIRLKVKVRGAIVPEGQGFFEGGDHVRDEKAAFVHSVFGISFSCVAAPLGRKPKGA